MTLISQNPSSSDGPVPYDIAIDPHARALYWSDSHSNVINVTRLDGSTIGIVVRDGQPRSIALAAEEGYLVSNHLVSSILFSSNLFSPSLLSSSLI